jgi:hypothetical protein
MASRCCKRERKRASPIAPEIRIALFIRWEGAGYTAAGSIGGRRIACSTASTASQATLPNLRIH